MIQRNTQMMFKSKKTPQIVNKRQHRTRAQYTSECGYFDMFLYMPFSNKFRFGLVVWPIHLTLIFVLLTTTFSHSSLHLNLLSRSWVSIFLQYDGCITTYYAAYNNKSVNRYFSHVLGKWQNMKCAAFNSGSYPSSKAAIWMDVICMLVCTLHIVEMIFSFNVYMFYVDSVAQRKARKKKEKKARNIYLIEKQLDSYKYIIWLPFSTEAAPSVSME